MSSPYNSTPTVSVIGCPRNDALRTRPYAPLGAAVWTSSGDLAQRGITAIAQAATGTMSPFAVQGGEPTRKSVSDSVVNALALASQNGRARLAIPFVASGIFLTRIMPACTKAELAEIIVKAAQDNDCGVQPVIVAYGAEDFGLFQTAISSLGATGVELVEGSVTDHALHGCDVIVNAANMEVEFGGGMSGKIGSATGQEAQINAEARKELQAFWAANPPG
ncbi:hypothetical protein [Roseovarius aestuariivivens]|uniref:hypothetical protein n=1 Tax=Roseovarius aestuariivivens TaxID=1888910 RepID=UPI001080BD82|nr:hypothetical protein [Roseovarius aestuariivivens]